MMGLTVIIPVRNEEMHLERCLDSVVGLTSSIFVVDSFSTDRTEEIARRYADRGVAFVQHAYAGPADQKNWALDELPIETPWVLFLDADEWLPPALHRELVARIEGGNEEFSGYRINRKIIWGGRWMKRGGWYPNWNLRLLRHGHGRYEQRRVHEHLLVDGPVGSLEEPMIHEDVRDMSFAIEKHNRYSTSEAAEYARLGAATQDGYGRLWSKDPLARRRWVKTRVWARLPLKPLWYFVYSYGLRLGFLDGAVGLRFHLMHAIFKGFDELKQWEMARQEGRRATPAAACEVGATEKDPGREPVATAP